MHAAAASDETPRARGSLRLAAFEVVWIFLIFFLYAGSPTPDAGESHYLVKAKHYWDPAWCAGDLFLESSNTHLAFYWALGWLTRWFSLDATTWILRVILWGLLAWAWRRLSWAIIPRPLMSLLTAAVMLLLAHHFHWAKELIFSGGVEGKTVAYIGVFLALEAAVGNRWGAAVLFAGAAAAFHVLVGGWTAIAIGLAWLAAGRERPPLASLVGPALGGLALALPGLIPALLLPTPTDPKLTAEAWRIYVFERLPHHLVFHDFPLWYQARHAALAAIWAALHWRLWSDAGLRRLALVVGGALAIGAVGIAIDQGCVIWSNVGGLSGDAYELLAAPYLRFYWFRVEDALLPAGASLACAAALLRVMASRPAVGNLLLCAVIVLVAANLTWIGYLRSQQRLPGAILQPQPTADLQPRDSPSPPPRPAAGQTTARQWYRDWRAVCGWIAATTPADARFLTPRHQQTFKWYAARAEAVTWKDIPQDAVSILEWKNAIDNLYPRDARFRREDLAAETDANLAMNGRWAGCQYIVIDRTRSRRPIGLPRVYPLFREENPSFEVYRVPELREIR